MQIGAQFYNLRDYCQNREGIAESLKKVADMGYRTVQISGTCPYDPSWLRDELQKNGLSCVLTHIPPKWLEAAPGEVARDHDVFSCRYVGLGMIPGGLAGGMEDYLRFVETYRPVARAIREAGHYFMYHNHNMEFARTGRGRETYLERMAEDFPVEDMGFTLDTYWIQAGGADPASVIRQMKGRAPCVHFKDMVHSLEDKAARMAPVGGGNLDFERILSACEDAGTQYILAEQDHSYGEDPFQCLRRSYEYLRSLGLN